MNRRRPIYYFLIAAYVVIAMAVTAVRSQQDEEDEINLGYRLAVGAILLAATILPSWMIEERLARLKTASRVEHDLRRLRRSQRTVQRAQQRAERDTAALGKRQTRWDHDEATLRATYLAELHSHRSTT